MRLVVHHQHARGSAGDLARAPLLTPSLRQAIDESVLAVVTVLKPILLPPFPLGRLSAPGDEFCREPNRHLRPPLIALKGWSAARSP